MRKPIPAFVLCVIAWQTFTVATAFAEQPRDYMLEYQPEGTRLLLDYFGTGGQVSLEHQRQIYGTSNDVTIGASAIGAYPVGEIQARVDLRILFLSLGASAAYRAVWRDLSFAPGEDSYCDACGRGARRDRDPLFGSSAGSQAFPWLEARANLFFPFNESVVMVATGAVREERRRNRSYDWFYATIYDNGILGRFETQLFLKHPDWGGIGPYVQLLSLPRAGEHELQFAGGFNAVTRLGLLDRNDLLFLTFLCRPGDPAYGQHNYFAPVRALLIYRMILDL